MRIGAKVRVVSLSGRWLDELPPDEHADVLSMIGEAFPVEEIDDFGHPWVRKSWPTPEGDRCHSHSVALQPEEMELVSE